MWCIKKAIVKILKLFNLQKEICLPKLSSFGEGQQPALIASDNIQVKILSETLDTAPIEYVSTLFWNRIFCKFPNKLVDIFLSIEIEKYYVHICIFSTPEKIEIIEENTKNFPVTSF